MPQISVIVCTFNPDRSILQRVIDALEPQIEPNDAEFILVDNNSFPPVEFNDLGPISTHGKIFREHRQGLARARISGIKAAQSDLLVFVDDDNILDTDYLESCLRIASYDESLGVVAGRSTGEFRRPPPCYIAPHLERYAVRDLGDKMLYQTGKKWESGEPYGAGMMVRLPVALAFAEFYDQLPSALQLGRRGEALTSGEDTLFCRLAHKLGYRLAYAPTLHLRHVIHQDRLFLRYFLRLLEAQGSSQVILDAFGGSIPRAPQHHFFLELALRFVSRVKHRGLGDAISFMWHDKGALNATSLINKMGWENIPKL